jgi:hypothetical protein
MQYHPNQSPESSFMDNMGDYMTDGKYSFVKRIWFILMDANAMLLMVILNKNMGLRIARQGGSLVALIWLFILFSIATFTQESNAEQGINDETLSGPLFVAHGFIYLIFAFWRKIDAWWNMRNSGRPDVRKRLDYGIGDSVIYTFLHWIFRPLKLVDNEVNPKTLWKLNEARWMQIWQPLILMATGFYLMTAGYEVYGKFLMFATVCFFLFTFKAFDNTARVRQSQVDAEITSDMIDPQREEDNRHIIGG